MANHQVLQEENDEMNIIDSYSWNSHENIGSSHALFHFLMELLNYVL